MNESQPHRRHHRWEADGVETRLESVCRDTKRRGRGFLTRRVEGVSIVRASSLIVLLCGVGSNQV